MDVVEQQLLARRQVVEVKAERSDVLRQFLSGLLEGHENARLVEFRRAADQKLHGKQCFTAPGRASDQGGASARQPSPGYLIEAFDASGRLGQRLGFFAVYGMPRHAIL